MTQSPATEPPATVRAWRSRTRASGQESGPSEVEVPEHRRYDYALVRRMMAGDERALDELYERHAKVLQAIALKMLKSPADAEDVLQETFLYLWRRAHAYDPAKASVWSWMSLILRSRCIDRVRNARAHRERAEGYRREAETSAPAAGWSAVLSGQRAARVRRALEILPAAQRRVLELCYFGGLTQSEVAERERIPLGTVKTRTLLAMRKLRAELSGELAALV